MDDHPDSEDLFRCCISCSTAARAGSSCKCVGGGCVWGGVGDVCGGVGGVFVCACHTCAKYSAILLINAADNIMKT